MVFQLLLLQICQKAGEERKILYVSGEESEGQIKIRAERLGVTTENLYLVSETDVETVIECINEIKPDIVIIDSIQTIYQHFCPPKASLTDFRLL